MTQRFDVFFDLPLNKQFSKQLWGWWFETLLHPLWHHCNGELFHYLQHSAHTCHVTVAIPQLFLPTLIMEAPSNDTARKYHKIGWKNTHTNQISNSCNGYTKHYNDFTWVLMHIKAMATQLFFSQAHSGLQQSNHQRSALLSFCERSHRWQMNYLHNGPVMQKCFHVMTWLCIFAADIHLTFFICPKFW